MKSLVFFSCLAATAGLLMAADVRLEPPKDLDGYFPWEPPATKEAWDKRAGELRDQLKVALSLVPEPTRTPLNPVIHGKIEKDEYTVEKVFFESLPGFFVTGNLYRPKPGAGAAGANGKRAGVLCPHGHWNDGRFTDAGDAGAKKAIEQGAEKFAAGAHSPLQARCVHLARMGCVVFHYDMIGYADSVQISMEVAHRFAKQRPMKSPEGWGLYSPRAEAWLQSIMGLQTWNSIRALDFVQSLPEVDGRRIGCTGASGGGTQTFLLGAVDPRVTAIFPAVMVSTAMQGGCTCENATLLRVGTGNIEITALFAPKPAMMTAANDWTKEMETKGFPQLKAHWTRLGSPDNVALLARLEFDHNYNLPSRDAMYGWFNKHLALDLPAEKLVERDFERLTRDQMSVWDPAHAAPTGDQIGAAFEMKLTRWLADDAAKQIAERPELAATGWKHVIGRTLATAGEKISFDRDAAQTTEHPEYTELRGPVVNETYREEVQTTFYYPKNWNSEVVLWLSDENALPPSAQEALKKGTAIVQSKLFRPGEKNRPVSNPREAPAYTYGYNRPLLAQRVHDALTLVQFVRTRENYPVKKVALHGDGPIYSRVAAIATAREKLDGWKPDASSDPDDPSNVSLVPDDYLDPNFLPGAARYPLKAPVSSSSSDGK
ncbi:MAG: acetylxylan esterase [Verrucomicrobiales bacterium]